MTNLIRLATPLSILVLSFSILVGSETIGSSIHKGSKSVGSSLDSMIPTDYSGRIKIEAIVYD